MQNQRRSIGVRVADWICFPLAAPHPWLAPQRLEEQVFALGLGWDQPYLSITCPPLFENGSETRGGGHIMQGPEIGFNHDPLGSWVGILGLENKGAHNAGAHNGQIGLISPISNKKQESPIK